jgi:hypothetical protein
MKLFSEYDRFELEQDIMAAWDVTNMLDELVRQHLDNPEPFSEDELANRISGIKYVTEMRFQRLWDGFEVMLKNGKFTPSHFAEDVHLEKKVKKK